MRQAIIRHADGRTASFRLDAEGAEGVCEYDLAASTVVLVRGGLGSLAPQELLYRIWRQTQDARLSDKALRRMWKARSL